MTQAPQSQFSLRGAVDLSGLGRPAPTPTAGAAPTGDSVAGAYVIDVTDVNFQQVIESSTEHLVVMLLWLPTDPTCVQLSNDLSAAADQRPGAFQLARVDAEAHPAIAGAFQAQGVPYVVAIVGGQPVPLFQGVATPEQIAALLDQVVAAAQSNGVTGMAPQSGPVADSGTDQGEPEPAPLPPLHQEAFDAIEAGDFAGAQTAYRAALRDDPRDRDAAAGLAQVELLMRLEGADAAVVRTAAADCPDDVDAQLAVADLDVAGGKVQDALDRLIDMVVATSGDDRERLRLRLVDYFAILGTEDPRVSPARRKLTNALY